jgi:hypothetical protein
MAARRPTVTVEGMSDERNDLNSRPGGDRRNVYRDLRRRNERRLETAQVLEDRRRRQIERILEATREAKFRESRQ